MDDETLIALARKQQITTLRPRARKGEGYHGRSYMAARRRRQRQRRAAAMLLVFVPLAMATLYLIAIAPQP